MNLADCSDLARWCGLDDAGTRRDAAALAAAEAHAAACAACRADFAADLALWRALAAPCAAPASLTPPYRPPTRRAAWAPRAAAAAIVVAATWFGFRVGCDAAGRDAERTPPAVDDAPTPLAAVRVARVVVLDPAAVPPPTFVQTFVVERTTPGGSVLSAEGPAPARVLVREL